jgi:hypothetical protein
LQRGGLKERLPRRLGLIEISRSVFFPQLQQEYAEICEALLVLGLDAWDLLLPELGCVVPRDRICTAGPKAAIKVDKAVFGSKFPTATMPSYPTLEGQ